MGTLIYIVLLGALGYFAFRPLRAAAEYRFRKPKLVMEGLVFLGIALVGLFSGSFLLLGAGAAAGVALHSREDNNRRYLE